MAERDKKAIRLKRDKKAKKAAKDAKKKGQDPSDHITHIYDDGKTVVKRTYPVTGRELRAH